MIPRRKIYTLKGEFAGIIKDLLRPKKSTAHLELMEKKFAEYLGVKHVIAVSSGRHAMRLILQSLNLNKMDEVIIPAYTLKDLVPIIQSLGLVAVAADIDADTFNISPQSVKKRSLNALRSY